MKIYGIHNCPECRRAKEKYKDAEYIDLSNYTTKQMEEFKNRLLKDGNISGLKLPIFEDEDGNIK